MTFHDLPRDWPTRSVTDPDIFIDLVDLIVRDRDRHEGALVALICSADGRLVQPVVVSDIPVLAAAERAQTLNPLIGAILAHVPGGSLVIVVARPGRRDTIDSDREWHESAIRVCRAAGVQLSAFAVATPTRIWRMDDKTAAGLETSGELGVA